jgi:ketosteroid isomerase-like protein
MNSRDEMLRDDPRTVVLRQWSAVARRDLHGVAKELADHATWQIMGGGFLPRAGRYEGKESIVRDLLSLGSEFFDPATYSLTITATYVDGPHVILEFVVDAINRKGRHYDNSPYCAVFTVVDGKVTNIREYVDSYKVKTVNVD